MTFSDPFISHPDQFGQNNLYLGSKRPVAFMPTGRLHGGPHYLKGSVVWDDPTDIPQEDQRFLFDPFVMEREYLLKYIPYSQVADWVQNTKPVCRFTMAHYFSELIGTQKAAIIEDPAVAGITALSNTRWYLFYGNIANAMTGIQYLAAFDQTTSLSRSIAAVDSLGQPAGGLDDGPASSQGWTLVMAHQYFYLTGGAPPDPTNVIDYLVQVGIDSEANPPPNVAFHSYAAYHMLQPDPTKPWLPPPIFDASRPTQWRMFARLLNFPQHTLTLEPFQA